MAWLKWHTTKSGRRIAHLQWRDDGGRVRSKSLKTSDERLAEIHRRQKGREMGTVPGAPVSRRTAAEHLEAFLLEKSISVRKITVDQYREKLGPLFKAWEGTPVQDWSRQAFVEYVNGHEWSPRTKQMVIGCCQRFIRWAHDNDIPIPDFARGVKGPKVRRARRATLTQDQLRAVLSEARGHALELPIFLAALAGLEPADFRALQWENVDMDARMIEIRRSKTGEEVRAPISDTLYEVLASRRALSGPVCRGLPKSRSSTLKSLHRLCARAGLPEAKRGEGGWLRFRHTAATDLAEKRLHVSNIAQLLGHAHGSAVTLGYIQSDDGQTRAAVNHRDRLLFATPTPPRAESAGTD